MADQRFALLIDSDNVSAKYISGILDELTRYGVVTYKRIYGDWTRSEASKWKDQLLANSIVPIQQFSNTTGKNATDSTLIIDAMDILYEGKVDGFCIVSSDSDFTRLASRLRESGMAVLGMGEEKTPLSFRNACTKFIALENLVAAEEDSTPDARQDAVESTIAGIISEDADRGHVTLLSEIGSRLSNKYPDFDVRNFGYSSLSRFIDEMPRFKVTKTNSTVAVSLEEDVASRDAVADFVKKAVDKAGARGIGINALSNLVHSEYPEFNLKDYGYAQFYKFVQNIKGIDVETRPGGKRAKPTGTSWKAAK